MGRLDLPVRLFTHNQAITALTLAERLAAGYGDDDPMTGRLIRLTTALAVVAIAGVAAIISYRHACGLVTSHGETGLTARLLPFTIDGLIWAASMVVLDASRRHHPVPSLAKWSLAVSIVATTGANLVHGLNQRGLEGWDINESGSSPARFPRSFLHGGSNDKSGCDDRCPAQRVRRAGGAGERA